ncbi:glycosyltransferase family 4 protein [Halomonas garicola]|uniref:glycosyltransferase family 4 protein n=1 Tax=Halomonas garicola TaxID=1690008 RepID=UPI0028A2B869|nr:glycosyltransferase family 4 protein [Halomonas garicola]
MKQEIVILARSLPHHGLGGMEVVAWDLAVEFARLEYPVRVITTSLPDRRGEFEQDGVYVVPLAKASSGRYSRAWWRESRHYFSAHCMDTTLAVLSVSAAAFGILPLKKHMPDVPFIMQAHGTSWGEVISKWRSKRLRSLLGSAKNIAWLPKDMHAYRKFDAVIAVGERVFKDLRRVPVNWALPENHVHLMKNGIDTAIFHPSMENRVKVREYLGISGSTSVIISASRLHAQKGIVQGLKSFAKILGKFPDAVYLIAGDGPERERLETLANDLDIIHSVRFLGAIKRNELAQFLQASDVFLFLTERIEVGVTLNVMEALSTGLPCVVSDHLSLPVSSYIYKVRPSVSSAVEEAVFFQLSRNDWRFSESNLPSQYALRYVAENYLKVMAINREVPPSTL